MCKTIGKVAILAVLVGGGIVAVRSSSYLSTLWSNTQQAVARQVPRGLEIDRVRLQISKLDGDVRGLLGPVAEKMALVKKLEREVGNAQENLKVQREAVVALTREIENGEAVVSVKGTEYTLNQAKTKLGRDFTNLKRGETALKTQEKLLDAHRKNLQFTKDQLNIILDQKREFEVQLAQLEANEAELTVLRQVTPLKVDESRIADIKATLDSIRESQEIETNKRHLEQQWAPILQGQQPTTGARPTTVDLNEVKTYLGLNGEGNRVADSK